MKIRQSPWVFAALATLSWLGASNVAHASDSVARFYSGKTVTIIVGVTAGGVYDLSARLLARYMPRHLPGTPSMIVQNMAGGGGLVAANYMFNAAPREGTAISVPLSGIVVDQLLRPEHVKYDGRQFGWLGSLATITDSIAVLDTAPAKTIEDAKRTEVIIGTSGKGSQIYQEPALVKALLGVKFKMVEGYRGGTEIILAMERGEVHGRANAVASWSVVKPEWVRERKLVHLIQIGPRDATLIGVPNFIDLVKTEREKAMVEVLNVSLITGRAVYTTPNVPAERLEALRKAFDATMADPEFRRDAEQQKLDLHPITGADLQRYVEETLRSSALVQAAADFKATLNY